MESEAFAYLNVHPEQMYDLTIREYTNLMDGYRLRQEAKRLENADLVFMQMRAKSGKKRMTMDDILGNKKESKNQKDRRVVSLDEKRSELDDLNNSLGGAV